MRYLVVAILVAAGCTSTGVNRHTKAVQSARATTTQAYALDSVDLAGVRAGQLSASREWTRADANREVARDDAADLRATLVHDLSRFVRLDNSSPIRLHTTLTLQTPGYFEGLA